MPQFKSLISIIFISSLIAQIEPAIARAPIPASVGEKEDQLLRSLSQGHSEMVKHWLNKGANPNQPVRNQIPISVAVGMGRLDLVQQLLKAGANTEPPALPKNLHLEFIPLVIAVRDGFPRIADLLLKHKANPDSADRNGNTPIVYAVRRGERKLVQTILAQLKRAKHPIDWNALWLVAHQRGYPDIADDMQAQGAKPLGTWTAKEKIKTVAEKERPAYLQSWATQGEAALVVEMLQSYPDLLSREGQLGGTVLHWAAKSRQYRVVEEILKLKPPLEFRDRLTEYTPVLYAFHSLPMIQLFKKHGANLKTRSKSRDTLAHFAAGNNRVDILKYLKSEGVSLTAPNSAGRTPILKAVSNDSLAAVQYLLDQKASLQSKDPHGMNAFHFAQSPAMVKLLVSQKLNINLQSTRYGESPLHQAAKQRKPWLARALIESGARLEVKNRRGQTAQVIIEKYLPEFKLPKSAKGKQK